jgi:hypothetical protein
MPFMAGAARAAGALLALPFSPLQGTAVRRACETRVTYAWRRYQVKLYDKSAKQFKDVTIDDFIPVWRGTGTVGVWAELDLVWLLAGWRTGAGCCACGRSLACASLLSADVRPVQPCFARPTGPEAWVLLLVRAAERRHVCMHGRSCSPRVPAHALSILHELPVTLGPTAHPSVLHGRLDWTAARLRRWQGHLCNALLYSQEKAFAKFVGSYHYLSGGMASWALETLTGAGLQLCGLRSSAQADELRYHLARAAVHGKVPSALATRTCTGVHGARPRG